MAITVVPDASHVRPGHILAKNPSIGDGSTKFVDHLISS